MLVNTSEEKLVKLERQLEENNMKKLKRLARHKKVRKNITGTDSRLRVAVFRSTKHIYAQVIDDTKGVTLTAASDLTIKKGTKSERATQVGETLAKQALEKKIKNIVFDRGGFRYHGRVAALAEGLRKGGLSF
jgi:large subunit ribosomal protein L18